MDALFSMKKAFLLLFLISLFSSVLFSKPLFAQTPANVSSKEYSVTQLIAYFSDKYGANYNDLYSTGKCESGLNPSVIGDNNLAHGVFQIHEETFNRWSSEMKEDLDYNSAYDQIKISAWAFAKGEKYRRSWTMYRALKNGGVYSFHSKLLKKDFTVHCVYS